MERAELKRWVLTTGYAEEHGGCVFLCDPSWTAIERGQVAGLLASAAETNAVAGTGWLCVPTGGSSGRIRFARHDERTLGAAVGGFCRHFGIDRVNAVDVLPPFHVSGLMARVRCHATGGRHVPVEWRALVAGERPALGPGDWVISLVPTQLQRLLALPEALEWLNQFQLILLGGGPVWTQLADAAAEAKLPVSLSYGMTETAAMVAALLPEDFRAGARDSGQPLPHARLSIDADGAILVEGESVFRGYFPELRDIRQFVTDDAGHIDEHGHLHVFGRRDAVIITGGKKVQPGEVEAVLRATGRFDDVAVIGVPDAEWGETVVACYPAGPRQPDLGAVRRLVEQQLAGFKRPKSYVEIARWPRTEHGKLNRTKLGELAKHR